MAIDFPASPTNGQTFTSGSVTYTWDGTKWTAVAAGGGSSNSISQGNTNATVTDTGSDGRFVVTTEGTEALRVDASRRLLVGTTSYSGAGAKFVVQGSGYTQGGMILARNGLPTGANDVLGLFIYTDSNYNEGAIISAARDGGTWTSGSSHPSRLVFSTTADGASSPTERMRIANNGKLYFGLTSDIFNANFRLDVEGQEGICVRANASGGAHYASRASSSNAGGYHYYAANTSGTAVYYVTINGNVQNTNNSYGAISDIKLKENIVDASTQWNDIKALQVRKYNFKEETGQQTHTQIGLIAQEVELVSPGLVSESPDRDEEGNDLGTVTKSVNYSVLYMKAVKALQEAMERIETLEAKVAALESA